MIGKGTIPDSCEHQPLLPSILSFGPFTSTGPFLYTYAYIRMLMSTRVLFAALHYATLYSLLIFPAKSSCLENSSLTFLWGPSTFSTQGILLGLDRWPLQLCEMESLTRQSAGEVVCWLHMICISSFSTLKLLPHIFCEFVVFIAVAVIILGRRITRVPVTPFCSDLEVLSSWLQSGTCYLAKDWTSLCCYRLVWL